MDKAILEKAYNPKDFEERIYKYWMDNKYFAPNGNDDTYVIVIPPPNVTGILHMGHGLNNSLQDILIRYNRMLGKASLWVPGTDHAGIATQAVIEKRLFELEGKTRHDIGREALVARIWEWKEQCEQRIIRQLQSMGVSCDWDRQRFTLDDICTRAVR